MGFKQAYFSFSGRMSRKEFWLPWYLGLWGVSIGYQIMLMIIASGGRDGQDLAAFLYVVSLLVFIPMGISLFIKRLHDRGRSAWFLLIVLIPIVNLWVIVEALFLSGQVGENKYGPDPLSGEGGQGPETWGQPDYQNPHGFAPQPAPQPAPQHQAPQNPLPPPPAATDDFTTYMFDVRNSEEGDFSIEFEASEFQKAGLAFGRNSDVVILDQKMSRKHFRVFMQPGQKQLVIEDLGSSNGTFLNGLRLQADKPALLCNGDEIKIGEVMITVSV